MWETVEELIDLVMDAGNLGIENRFLSLLDRLAYQISEADWISAPDALDAPDADYQSVRKAAEAAFPDLGF